MSYKLLKKLVISLPIGLRIAVGVLMAVVAIIFLAGVYISTAPSNYPRGTIVRISKDMSVTSAASLLKEKGIVRSAFVYKAYVVLLHEGKGIQQGSYLFDEPQSALRVAYRTAYGVKDMEKIRLTIFEGTNSKVIAAIIQKSIPAFDTKSFIAKAQKYEGYLFPETYFVDQDVTPGEIIDTMRDQFDDQIAVLDGPLATSTHSMKDIITMASIIEKEANNPDDKRIISGILWKRIAEGMPLQVDVPFYYVMNVGTKGLSLTDLATSSPYNTYTHKGLPPTPITNPGIDSIKAALYPVKSPYYFYLADGKGVTHYAKDHEGHVANKVRYLQ